jgi:hypothetical protein
VTLPPGRARLATSTLQNEPRRGQLDETQIQTEAYIGILVPSRRRFLTLGSFFEPDLLKK